QQQVEGAGEVVQLHLETLRSLLVDRCGLIAGRCCLLAERCRLPTCGIAGRWGLLIFLDCGVVQGAPPRAMSSRARRREASEPACLGARLVIGSAATEASGNFTVRLITDSKTFSPKASVTRAMTSFECKVRESNMVARIPSISSEGLSRSWTFSMVSMSRATPRRAKNSVSSGMITPWEAVSALTASR